MRSPLFPGFNVSNCKAGCHMTPPTTSVLFLWLLVAVVELVRSLPLICKINKERRELGLSVKHGK